MGFDIIIHTVYLDYITITVTNVNHNDNSFSGGSEHFIGICLTSGLWSLRLLISHKYVL